MNDRVWFLIDFLGFVLSQVNTGLVFYTARTDRAIFMVEKYKLLLSNKCFHDVNKFNSQDFQDIKTLDVIVFLDIGEGSSTDIKFLQAIIEAKKETHLIRVHEAPCKDLIDRNEDKLRIPIEEGYLKLSRICSEIGKNVKWMAKGEQNMVNMNQSGYTVCNEATQFSLEGEFEKEIINIDKHCASFCLPGTGPTVNRNSKNKFHQECHKCLYCSRCETENYPNPDNSCKTSLDECEDPNSIAGLKRKRSLMLCAIIAIAVSSTYLSLMTWFELGLYKSIHSLILIAAVLFECLRCGLFRTRNFVAYCTPFYITSNLFFTSSSLNETHLRTYQNHSKDDKLGIVALYIFGLFIAILETSLAWTTSSSGLGFLTCFDQSSFFLRGMTLFQVTFSMIAAAYIRFRYDENSQKFPLHASSELLCQYMTQMYLARDLWSKVIKRPEENAIAAISYLFCLGWPLTIRLVYKLELKIRSRKIAPSLPETELSEINAISS